MKKLLIPLTVYFLFPVTSHAQDTPDQKEVWANILNNKSIEVFFKDRDIIYLKTEKNCSWKVDEEVHIGNKKIKLVNKDFSQAETLKIVECEETDKIIFIELTLFNQNVIYSALYKKRDGKLLEVMTNTTFIKSGKH